MLDFSPRNLQKITPEGMGFQITDFDQKSMYPGQIIQYKVTPLFGITLSWMTLITQVKENSSSMNKNLALQFLAPQAFLKQHLLELK
jgi:hypothetical protein